MSEENQPMIHVNLRLPKEVIDHYKSKYPLYTRGMREVLEADVKRCKKVLSTL